ncbi:Hypothetical predicted protein [Pelobates cultripes]|uniref:Uncharacterized protein n=1 Tax=Pelobates cultripes TaxID=61616 RepID=A0AAD1R4Z5_PELCU|nr:Hypothetical predicted protein [Pelobates cultripes]
METTGLTGVLSTIAESLLELCKTVSLLLQSSSCIKPKKTKTITPSIKNDSQSEDEVMSECPEPMVTMVTTIPISRSAGKNTAKPCYGAPGLIKASDGTILPIEKLTKHERYLAERRFVEANPLELAFKQNSTSTPDQPATMGTIITESDINGKENAIAEELSPNPVRATNGMIAHREDLAIFEKALKDREMKKKT